jgi:hypothetical protein
MNFHKPAKSPHCPQRPRKKPALRAKSIDVRDTQWLMNDLPYFKQVERE